MIFIFCLVIAITGALYAIKGGQHVTVKFREKLDAIAGLKGFLARAIVDGHNLSAILFGIATLSWGAALGWYLGCKPSLGEQVPAIGGIKGNWVHENGVDRFLTGGEAKTTRISALKYGLIRGVFMGACVTFFLDDRWFIIAGATWPAAVFIGVSIGQLCTGAVDAGWRTYEWIYGMVLGIALYHHYSG